MRHTTFISKGRSLLLLLASLVIDVVPAIGNDYVKIFRNDGSKPTYIYMADIDSMVYSKIDERGVLQADWQVQEIYTTDSLYRIPLTDIDSVAIEKFDVERAVEMAVNVSGIVERYFLNCNSIGELIAYIPEIKKADGVEDISYSSDCLYITLENGEELSYMYPPEPSDADWTSMVQTVREQASLIKQKVAETGDANNQAKKILILDALSNNLIWTDKCKTVIDNLTYAFHACGFDSIRVVNNPTPSCYGNDIYDSDVLFLMNHGGYNREKKLHSLTTGEIILLSYIPQNKDEEDNLWALAKQKFDKLYKKEEYRRDEYTLDCIYEKRKSKLGTEIVVAAYYIKLSEKFFENNNKERNKQFKNGAIVFNPACHSLEDNDSFGNVFLNSGAGFYLGFDEENKIGIYSGYQFLLNMLSGYSIRGALLTLPESLRTEHRERKDDQEQTVQYTANLKYLPKHDDKQDVDLFLVHPQTRDAAVEFDGILKGEVQQLQPVKDNIRYGFLISRNMDMTEAQLVSSYRFNQCMYDYNSHVVSFKTRLESSDFYESGIYYFCAYLNDGQYYNCGDVKQFVIQGPPVIVSTVEATDVGAASAQAMYMVEVQKDAIQENSGVIGIQYGLTSDLDQLGEDSYFDLEVWNPNSDIIHYATFTKLDPKTKYYYRAYAVVDGERYFGETQSFTTKAITIKTFDAKNVSETTAHIDGELLDKDAINAGDSYGFCLSTSAIPSPENSYIANGTFSEASDGTFWWDITDLKTGTTYFYSAFITYKGIAYWGEVKSFRTLVPDNPCPDNNHPHAIDLGIGVKWSCCNVGAKAPEEYGGYYAWGETGEKDFYGPNTYQYSIIVNSGSNPKSRYYNRTWYDAQYIGDNISGSSYDAAHANLGDQWRIPTSNEAFSLSKCSSEWITLNGVYGRKFTGKNGNWIFIPAAGFYLYDKVEKPNVYGVYWTSDYNSSDMWDATTLEFRESLVRTNGYYERYYGLPIRPVAE